MESVEVLVFVKWVLEALLATIEFTLVAGTALIFVGCVCAVIYQFLVIVIERL